MTKLTCEEFGRRLIITNDLDPVYVYLWEAQLEPKELERWLLAYWSFYHMGTASWIADQSVGYWDRFQRAANSKDWPRGTERRHYRAQNAIKSASWLRSQGLTSLMSPLRSMTELTQVMKYVQTWVGYGPWIAFKVADMLERLNLCPLSFTDSDAFLFDSPAEGARLLWEHTNPGINPDNESSGVNQWALDLLVDQLDLSAPPRYERRVGPQEVETVLCKWKSYWGGHYKLGEDLLHSRKGLESFKSCRMAQRLLHAGRDL